MHCLWSRNLGSTFHRAGPLLGLLLLCACSPEPSSPFGTYTLKSCLFLDSIPHPLPCVTEGSSPGDSERVEAGSFSLRADSTWENTFQKRFFANGSWGATSPYTFGGTFTLLPSQDYDQMFQLYLIPAPYDPRLVVAVRGETLNYAGSWLYKR